MKVPMSISFDLEVLQKIKEKCYIEQDSVSNYVNELVKKDLQKEGTKTTTKKEGKK